MEKEIDRDADRNFRTYIPNWLWEKYFKALGYFMHSFARAEADLQLSVRNYAEGIMLDNVSRFNADESRKTREKRSSVLQAIMARNGLETAKDTLLLIMKINEEHASTTDEVKRVFLQFKLIQNFRNKIAHNYAIPDMTDKDEWFYLNDSFLVKEISNSKTLYFQPETLTNMAIDLSNMPDYLYQALTTHTTSTPYGFEIPKFKDMNGPWRFHPKSIHLKKPTI
jgi:hypothetical protein